jgi:hypothetical protein
LVLSLSYPFVLSLSYPFVLSLSKHSIHKPVYKPVPSALCTNPFVLSTNPFVLSLSKHAVFQLRFDRLTANGRG